MSDLFHLAKYRMEPPTDGFDGGIVLASGIARHTLERRELDDKWPHLRRRLLDPQLYLSGLSPSNARDTCAKLVSYPWFASPEVQEFDSGQITQRDWMRETRTNITALWRDLPRDASGIEPAVDGAIRTQQDLGCEAIILPSPLTIDPNTSYEQELLWLEIGLSRAERLAPDLPALPTVALADSCTRSIDPVQNTLISMILDQVAARATAGVYLTFELGFESGYYCRSQRTIGAMLRLVDGFKRGGLGRVIANFIGVAGLLAVAAGADTWSTGWYRSERRLRLADFEAEDEFARSYPSLYVHRLASDIHVRKDLKKLVDAGYLARLVDSTSYSRLLYNALEVGQGPDDVGTWRPTQSNVQRGAIPHFAEAMIRETATLNQCGSPDERRAAALRWLEEADGLARELYGVLGDELHDRTELDHQNAWLRAFRGYLQAL